jgi:phenylpropionate dioxygenase-like ring-hydroxylating dioxygenase large terminal subunit
VAEAAQLHDAPLAVRLMGRDLVLWRDGQGRVQAADDRCLHRGARLSLGRVVRGELQCGYHGWCYASDGRCTRVPALPDFLPPESLRLSLHAVQERHGLLWCASQAGAAQLPPPWPTLQQQGLPPREVVCGPFDVATSAPRVVENFLDMSHFAFVHTGLLGHADHSGVPEHRVDLAADGRPVVEHYRAWQPQASAGAAGGAWVDYRYEVLGPYAALLGKRAEVPGAPQEAYALWATPLDEEATRVWFTLFTSDAAADAAALRAFQALIFEQDRPVLESQRPRRLPLSGGEHPCAADRLSVAYRRYLQATATTYGVC